MSRYVPFSSAEVPFYSKAIRAEWYTLSGFAFTLHGSTRPPVDARLITDLDRRRDVEILTDFFPARVRRMLRAPGFLPELLVLQAADTGVVVIRGGAASGRGFRLGRRVGDGDAEIETRIHGFGEIEGCAAAEVDADFLGYRGLFCAITSCAGRLVSASMLVLHGWGAAR